MAKPECVPMLPTNGNTHIGGHVRAAGLSRPGCRELSRHFFSCELTVSADHHFSLSSVGLSPTPLPPRPLHTRSISDFLSNHIKTVGVHALSSEKGTAGHSRPFSSRRGRRLQERVTFWVRRMSEHKGQPQDLEPFY